MLTSPPPPAEDSELHNDQHGNMIKRNNQDVKLEKLILEWEAKFTKEHLEESDDPFSTYEQYYNVLLAFKDSTKLLDDTITSFLERVTKLFVNDKRYKQDSRYLNLWIAYSSKCVEPLNIFSFLGSQGIASNLSSFYEEYSSLLFPSSPLLALQTLENGIRRDAEPLERLKKTYRRFIEANPLIPPSKDIVNMLGLPSKRRKIERPSYIPPLSEDGITPISFEEARSQQWRKGYNVLRDLGHRGRRHDENEEQALPSSNVDDEYEGNLLADEDNLTNISVYKDNTADLRELAEAMRRQQQSHHQSMDSITDFPVQLPSSSPIQPATKESIFNTIEVNDSSTMVGGIRISLVPKELFIEIMVDDGDDSFIFSQQRQGQQQEIESCTIPAFSIDEIGKGDSFDVGDFNYWVEDSLTTSGSGVGVSGDSHQCRRRNKLTLTGMEIKDSDTTGDMKIILIKFSTGNDLLVEEFLLRIMSVNAHLSYQIPCPLKLFNINDNSYVMHTQSFIRHSMSIRTYLGLDAVSGTGTTKMTTKTTIKDEKLLFFWLRELLCFIKSLLSLKEGPVVHGMLGLQNVLIRIGEDEQPLGVVFSCNGLNGWSGRGIAVVQWTRGRQFLLEDNGSNSNDVVFRSSTGGGGDGEQVLLRDISMFLIDLMEIRTVIGDGDGVDDAGSTHQTSTSELPFQRVQEGIEDLLGDGVEPRSLGMILEHLEALIGVMDEVLVEHSTKRPTLKSLLTKLEISLLE